MRLHLTMPVLFAASVLAQDMEEVPEKRLPEGGLSRAERDAPAVSVRVREAGVLQVKVGDEWKDATLKEYSALLKSSAEEYDRDMRKGGKSGYETPAKASKLFVSIDAEPTVPWQHIQWLMEIAAEQKFYKLEMSDGTRRLLAFLPTDKGIEPAPKEPPLCLLVPVHIFSRAEKPEKWGDVMVTRPTDARYKIGNEETAALPNVADFVKKGWAAIKDTPGASVGGEIKAGYKVPFARIFDVMEVFEASGCTRVCFYRQVSMTSVGTAVPSTAVREAARLPYPVKNYDTPD